MAGLIYLRLKSTPICISPDILHIVVKISKASASIIIDPSKEDNSLQPSKTELRKQTCIIIAQNSSSRQIIGLNMEQ